MTDLIDHLLEGRHRFQNQAIIDCLALARLEPSPRERQSVASLLLLLDVANRSNLSHKLHNLKRHGLIAYEPGCTGDTGYRITRVGPA